MKPARMTFGVDSTANAPERIQAYFNCAQCLTEIKEHHLPVSPREYKRLDIGFTADGILQVWCTRHECNVALVNIVKAPPK